MKTRHTFKPQLESLERRDVPSAAGIGLYLQMNGLQQEVQTMQSQANAAQTAFTNLGKDLAPKGNFGDAASQVAKLGGAIQSVRTLDAQLNAQLQNFNQEILMVASDGDQADQGVALYAYLQVNGGFGGLFGGNSSGGLSAQANSALDMVNKQIAGATHFPSPNENLAISNFIPGKNTIDDLLS